ncbi:unnamed protein product [Pylaiella littoralis]
MPTRNFTGKGWGVDPKRRGDESEATARDLVLLLRSEHSSISVDRKTKTQHFHAVASRTCPPHRMCKTCGCKERRFSLAYGCRGRCRLRCSSEPGACALEVQYRPLLLVFLMHLHPGHRLLLQVAQPSRMPSLFYALSDLRRLRPMGLRGTGGLHVRLVC